MKKQNDFYYKISNKIINARGFILILFIVLTIFSAFKVPSTVVQNDLTVYLS